LKIAVIILAQELGRPLKQFNISIRSALISTVVFLTMIGILSVFASSSVFALENYGSEWFFVQKQFLVAIFGFCLVFLVGHISIERFSKVAMPLYLLSLVLLFCLFVPGLGHKVKGATRWLSVSGLNFQPSELAKLALILILAKNLSRKSYNSSDPRCLVGSGVLFMVYAIPIMMQPDFGTVAILGLITLLMVWFNGLSFRYLIGIVTCAGAAFIGLLLMEPYRLKRLRVFLDPWAEYEGGGFQVIQSLLAYHGGGIFGVGLGESQQRLFFLPDAHTDFILAIIGEEFGLVGTLTIVLMFSYLLFLGYRIVQLQSDPYRRLLAFGLTALLSIQAMVNMSVTLGLIPTKGIGLPFVSNGASSLLCFLIAVAILSRLSQPDTRSA
jgi:cell division protein FtsW